MVTYVLKLSILLFYFLKKEDEIYSPTSRYNQTMKRENQEEILGRHIYIWLVPINYRESNRMNKFAEENQDIVEGLKRSSAAMAAMGQSFEDTAALFTGGMEILQDAEVMGTALRSVAMRIRGYDEETEELSDNLKNVKGEVVDLTKTASKPSGITIFADDAQTKYKSMVQYLGEISDIWDELSEKQQTELLEKLFGKTRAQAGAAILKNFGQVRAALEAMEDSAGSADKEMETVQSSIDYKLNELKQTWVGIVQDMADRGDIQKIIDALIELSEAIGFVADKLGSIGTIGLGVGIFAGFKNKDSLKDAFDIAIDVASIQNAKGSIDEIANSVSSLSATQAVYRMELAKCSEEEIISVLRKNKVAEADIKSALAKTTNTTATTTNTIATKAQTTAEEEYLIAQYESIGGLVADTTATTTDTVAKTTNLSITNLLTAAWTKLTAVIKANPIVAIAAATITVLYGVAKVIERLHVSMDELKEVTTNSISELSSINSEVETLEKELKTLNEQIEGLDPITDAQDIENLKAESEELENQLAILKEKQRIASNDADNAAQESLSKTQTSKYEFGEGSSYNHVTGGTITYKTSVEVTRMDELQNAMDTYDKYARKKADLEARMARMAEVGSYSQDKWDEYEAEIADLDTKMQETRAHASELAIEIDEESKALNGSTEESAELKESTTDLLTSYREWTGEINENTSALKENNKASENVNELFSSFTDTEIGQRLQHALKLFNEGKISYREYFDGLQTEIENVDFSHYTDSLEEAQNAAGRLFVDSTQQAVQGLSNLINSFNSNEMSVTEYLDGYLSIAETLNTVTEGLQENSKAWDKNGEALSDSENMNLDGVQSNLNSAIETIENYQDSIYGLEQILSGKLEFGTDDFTAHTNVIAEDLANIVASGGEMADEIKSYMGTSADEIAQSLTDDISNFDLASQAIAANTNVAIQNMATSVGILFEELGNAISNFKADLTFGVSSITMQDVDMGILGTHQLPAITFSLEANGDSLSSIGSAISNFGKNFSENMAQYIEYSDFTIEPEGDAYVPDDDILENYKNQMEKLKDASGDAGKDAAEEYKEALEKELSDLDTVLNFITDTIQDQIDAWNDMKDAAVDALEAERDVAIEALETQKEATQAKIDAKQDEIDKIKEAREERQAEIDLQKKQYDLERLQNQSTQLVYKDGQMVYTRDESAVRDAREQVDEAKENIKILQIEKEISELEDIIDSLDKQIDSINKHYDKLIEQTQKYYESLIKGMEEYKSRWEQIAEIEEQAKINVLLQELGITTDDVMNMSAEAFEQFKQRYLGVLTEMYKGNDDMVASLKEVASGTDFTTLETKIGDAKNTLQKFADTDFTNLKSNVTDVTDTLSTNTADAEQNISGIQTAINGIDIEKANTLRDCFEKLAIAIGTISNTLNGESGLISGLSSIVTPESLIGLINLVSQFNLLKDAVNQVSSAIGGGIAGDGGSQATEGGGLATGANGGAATPAMSSGSTGSLKDALKQQVEEAKTIIPEETALFNGEEESLLSGVNDVIDVLTGGEEKPGEGDKVNPSTLMGANQIQYNVANDIIPKEVILFENLKTAIEACVEQLREMVALMEGASDWKMMGTVPITPAAKGTSYAKKGLYIVGEEAPELIEDTKGNLSLATKPTLLNMKGGEKVYNGNATANMLTPLDESSLPYAMLMRSRSLFDSGLAHNTMSRQIDGMINTMKSVQPLGASQNVNLTIGDIQVHGVQDVNGLANAISTKLPNMLLQTITKR